MMKTPLFRTQQDRDGCPKIVNLGTSKTDLFYERKKYGFKRCVAMLVVSINWSGWVGGWLELERLTIRLTIPSIANTT